MHHFGSQSSMHGTTGVPCIVCQNTLILSSCGSCSAEDSVNIRIEASQHVLYLSNVKASREMGPPSDLDSMCYI